MNFPLATKTERKLCCGEILYEMPVTYKDSTSKSLSICSISSCLSMCVSYGISLCAAIYRNIFNVFYRDSIGTERLRYCLLWKLKLVFYRKHTNSHVNCERNLSYVTNETFRSLELKTSWDFSIIFKPLKFSSKYIWLVPPSHLHKLPYQK